MLSLLRKYAEPVEFLAPEQIVEAATYQSFALLARQRIAHRACFTLSGLIRQTSDDGH